MEGGVNATDGGIGNNASACPGEPTPEEEEWQMGVVMALGYWMDTVATVGVGIVGIIGEVLDVLSLRLQQLLRFDLCAI